MNVAALLQETPSEDVSARRGRSGSSAGGNNVGPSAPAPAPSHASSMDRERERERDARGRGRPHPPPPPGLPPPSSAGLRSLVHSPVGTRSNAPDGYRNGPQPHIPASPSSSTHHRGQAPLSPVLSMKDSKTTGTMNTSPSLTRPSGPQGYAGPHGYPHSSHPSPAMGSLRPNAAAVSGNTSSTDPVHSGSASQTSSGRGGGEGRPSSATGWSGPGYGGERERRGSASAGISAGGGLLRSNQPHSSHSSHSASHVYDKEYHQPQLGGRRKTVSGSGGPLGIGSAANSNNTMPPPPQLVGPGTGTPPDELPLLTHKSSGMARPMSHSGAHPPSMHGPPPTHQHSMSSSSFMERERDILLNREPRDHPMDHLRPSSTPAGPPPPSGPNPSNTPRQHHPQHPAHSLPPSTPSGPRGGPPPTYSQPGSGRVTPISDMERDRERERIMYNREREQQHQRERALSSASASASVHPSPMTSPRGIPYGPPPPPGHHASHSLPTPSGPGQAGSPSGSSRGGGPGQSPHIHPASGAAQAAPANPYATASGGFGHSSYGPPPPLPSSGAGHGPPLSSRGPSAQGPPPALGPGGPPPSARERERDRDRNFEYQRDRVTRDREREFRDREYQRDRESRERDVRERELGDRELRDRELREREFRERELRERDRDREIRERELRDKEIRERERDRGRDRDVVMRDVRPDPRDMPRDVGVPMGRPEARDPRDVRGDPRDIRSDPRDLRTDARGEPYRERERRDGHDRDWEVWERQKERERLEKVQWEREQEQLDRERREREQREHRERVDRERELKEKEAREREKEQIMIMREKQRERDLRERERELRERELQQLRGREGEARDGPSRNPTIIIGPGVPPPSSSSSAMQREQQRPSTSQAPPAAPSSVTPGPHPPQSHHQGRFNTAFISNFAGAGERGSRNNSRVSSPNPVMLGSQMSTISLSVGSMPTIGPGVPGPVNSSGGGMHVIPGGMLGGGLPSLMTPAPNDPAGRGQPSIPPDRKERDIGRDARDSKDAIRDRERERERDRDIKKPTPLPALPAPLSSRASGVSLKDQPPQSTGRDGRDRERERERERELYAAAIAAGSMAVPPSGSSGRRHGEGSEQHPSGHSRHPSLSQQHQQQQREHERERDRERERETRRYQSGAYPQQYDETPGPRERGREREHGGIPTHNAQQNPPSGREGEVDIGYGYPPPPPHDMGPPPPPGWHDKPGGSTPMEMGFHSGPPGVHHPVHHHPQSQPYVGYHSGPPPGTYQGNGQPTYGPPAPPPSQPYGHPHPQQHYGYDERGMSAPVDVNGMHHGPHAVVALTPGGNGAMHPAPSVPHSHHQHPHHPPQHLYNVPSGYISVHGLHSGPSGLTPPTTDGAQQGSGSVLPLPASSLALTAASPLELRTGQSEVVQAAEASALLQAEQEMGYERKPEVRAKTTVNLGIFVYPDLPFPYNFDLGGGMVDQGQRKLIVQEKPEKRFVVQTKAKETAEKEVKEVKAKDGAKKDAVEEGEIAEPVENATEEKAISPVVKDEHVSEGTNTSSVIDLIADELAAKLPVPDLCATLESDLDTASKVEPIDVDIETRVTIIIPHGHLPDEKPKRPRIWGGGVIPASPSKPSPNYTNGRTNSNEQGASRTPKTITRELLITLLPKPPATSEPPPVAPQDQAGSAASSDREREVQDKPQRLAYLTKVEDVSQTVLKKYTPRRIYTDDSDLALCAIHSGWVSWDGMGEAKKHGRDLRVEVKVMKVARLGGHGLWSGREVGKLVEVRSAGKDAKAADGDKERKEEVVTRFVGGLGERCWSSKGKHGWVEIPGEAVTTNEQEDALANPLNDGRALMSAAWGTGHDGAAIEILSAGFVERGTLRKAPGLGRRTRAQRMMEYAERRMAVLGQSPQQHPLLRTIAKGNANPNVVSSLTASPWNFTTTALAGRKRRRGIGYVNPHPPINARLPNAKLLEAINELDEQELEKNDRGTKRQRTGFLTDPIRLPGKTQEEWREDALMNLKTVVFATNTVPPPVAAEDSYPTSPTSPAGPNPITAGLLTTDGTAKKDATTGDAVRVGFKYDRAVLRQMLFPSDPSPPSSNSLKTSPAIDKEKAQLSRFLGALPRRQVILETATKERYLLTPKRADGSANIAVPDARKVLWAYDISLILEQEVIIEDVKDDTSGNVLGDLASTSPTSPPATSDAAQPANEEEPVQDKFEVTAEETTVGALDPAEEREEGELDLVEQPPNVVEPPQSAQDKDGDVEMGDGDKEPGELNEDEDNENIIETKTEDSQSPSIPLPSPAPITSHPPILKVDTINLAPSRAVSRVHSKLNSPVNPPSPVAASAAGADVSMDMVDEEAGEDSFVTLIRGEDEDGNEQSVHYPVQMLQRHVTEAMLRFEEEGIYVKEASFVGPTVPPSPSTSVAGDADAEKMDVVASEGPGGQPTEWRMQVVSWKWAGQA